MDTKELLSIIRACAQHGVREFAQGELKFSFYQKGEAPPQVEAPSKISTEPPKSINVPAVVEKRMDAVAAVENEKAAIKEVEDEIDELRLTDPYQYEERLARGELVDEPQVRH